MVLIFGWCLFSKSEIFSGAYFREWCLFSSGLIFEILRYLINCLVGFELSAANFKEVSTNSLMVWENESHCSLLVRNFIAHICLRFCFESKLLTCRIQRFDTLHVLIWRNWRAVRSENKNKFWYYCIHDIFEN